MKNYKSDKVFAEKHISVIELKKDDARVLLSPDLQGRVLTSSANGEEGYSFGWLNYDLISAGQYLPHCNNFGGEDRYWLGPEGGQFSLFFKNGTDFDFENWQAPSLIDTDSWNLVSHDETNSIFEKSAIIENYKGTKFNLQLNRKVSLLDTKEVYKNLSLKEFFDKYKNNSLDKLDIVAFSSDNEITNENDFEWNRETGMLSIWILGQFIPSDANKVIIPYIDSDEDEINDSYFGKIDEDRLSINSNILEFKGDGKKRGKIGLPPSMAKPIIMSLDEKNQTLTVVTFSFDKSKKDYINSMWEYQAEPFKGDVVNSYNDGPLEDGSIMGPFYEIETSSAATNLKPRETAKHMHTTYHFKGNLETLSDLKDYLIINFK